MTTQTALPKPMEWTFPLPRPHTGIPLGNGVQGLLVWGAGDTLCITIGRAGFWDRRGGNAFQNQTTFAEVKALLQAGDEAGLRRVFGQQTSSESRERPHQVGGGRLELHLPAGWTLDRGVLHPATGEIAVTVRKGAETGCLRLRQAVTAETAVLSWSDTLSGLSLKLRPSWEWVGDELAPTGVAPPEMHDGPDAPWFVQTLPADPPLGVAVKREGNRLGVGTAVGLSAREDACRHAEPGGADLQAASEWWAAYWGAVPQVTLPDGELTEMVVYGLYMQACATPPQGIACTLQGPFLEEVQIPPWSCDYHFNINIEMIYTPALATNRAEHLRPLWEMLKDWLPVLRKSGETFFGDPEALMLPHAVDDRCGVVGSFWTGCIDHGCTAWVALLCWDTVRYTGDKTLLKELGMPLLRGAFAGYWAMLETRPDGSLSLPVSVSPEFKGARMDAWGRDASFQLAAAHAVVRALSAAAAMLDEPADARWDQLRAGLPPYCAGEGGRSVESPETKVSRIFLWEGQDLDGSHRHHSHLAGVTPFKTLDARKEDPVIANSLEHLVYRGCGAWSGWCVPWAASLHTHAGQADAAVHWLHVWRRLFTNEGRGSLHDGAFPGVTTLAGGNGYLGQGNEIMQLDGRFGALTAVLDLLVQEFDGEIRPLPQLPSSWRSLSFSGIHAPGGFVLSAEVRDGELIRLEVESLRGENLRLRLPDGRRIERPTSAGELLRVLPES